MKNLFKIALVATALTMFACGGNTNTDATDDPEKQQTTVEEEANTERASESDIAYNVLNLMIKNGLDGSDEAMAQLLENRAKYQGVSEMKFDLPVPTDGIGNYYQCADDYEDIWTVRCYPRIQGGWTVLAGVEYVCGDWSPSRYFVYNYDDGKLTPAMELLPQPKFNDIYTDPEMLKGLSEERIASLKEDMDGNKPDVLGFGSGVYYFDIYDAPFIVLTDCQETAMRNANYGDIDFRFAKTVYLWDGEGFVKVGPVEGFAFGDCADGDDYTYTWSEEEGRFVPEDC